MRKINKITCIQLDGVLPDLCHCSVMPDYGLPLIGTILSEAGYDVKVFVEHIEAPNWDRIATSDLICFSTLSAAAGKTYRLAREIRSRLGIPIIIGGTHASYFPASCLQYCDYVVIGEGDETILELVETLAGRGEMEQVRGIAYRVGDKLFWTPPRPGPEGFDTIPNYSLIEGYSRMDFLDILVQRKKPWLTIQTSRGCPFDCTFCIVNTMFPGGYRKRDIESVIRDLRDKRQYGKDLMFVDNEFAAHPSYTKKLLRRMIAENFDFNIFAFARVGVAKDDELLSLMRQAGITYIYQGYESIQSEALTAYNKRQTFEEITAAIEKLHSFEFSIMGSFVLGADGDTLETIRSTVDFVLERRLSSATFFTLWGHYPEKNRGYRTIIPWYRSIFRGWRYANGHFVTHFPMKIPPSKLQREIPDIYRKIYSPKQALRAMKKRKFKEARHKIQLRYLWKSIEKVIWEYIPFLRELEDGLYDSNEILLEDLLAERVHNDPRWTFQAGKQTIEALGLSPPGIPLPGKQNITCPPVRSSDSRLLPD